MFNTIKVNNTDTNYTHSIFDISDYNSGATYNDLSAALAAIPESKLHGGMTVCYETDENKYVQYRLMTDEFTTDTTQWAIADEGVYVENSEFVYVKTDREGKILWAIKIDGGIYYGAGCPQQVKDYIEEKISSKLDAEGLDSDALATVQAVENFEWISVTTDSEGKILEGITTEGKKKVMVDVECPTIENLDSRVSTLEGEIQPLDLELTIPDVVYVIVDRELNLWNDAVSLSVDRGLASPMNYQIRWQCNKGLVTDRCFRYTPEASDAGSIVNCTCYMYDMKNTLITSKVFSIKVLAKDALNSAKNIVYFGDSLGGNTARQLYANFNSANFTGTIPTMLGTRGDTVHYEAVGGYTWASYATKGGNQYRIQVSGVTSVALGAIYDYNGQNDYTVREVNITGGIGNLLLERNYGAAGNIEGVSSGVITLISGSGDSSINFTDATKEPNNPLWDSTLNSGEGGLSVAKYKERLGLSPSDKIDAASFQFGINDANLANNLPKLMSYIDALYKAFINDNANCKFLIGLTTTSGNDVNGSGANYGASSDWMSYIKNVYTIRKFYLTLQNNPNYPNIVISPVHLQVDRYYGYTFGTRAISQRTSTTENYHNNFVHPGGDGYWQMADAYFATYIGSLIE